MCKYENLYFHKNIVLYNVLAIYLQSLSIYIAGAIVASFAQQKGQKSTEEHGGAKHKLHIFLLPLTSVIQP